MLSKQQNVTMFYREQRYGDIFGILIKSIFDKPVLWTNICCVTSILHWVNVEKQCEEYLKDFKTC